MNSFNLFPNCTQSRLITLLALYLISTIHYLIDTIPLPYWTDSLPQCEQCLLTFSMGLFLCHIREHIVWRISHTLWLGWLGRGGGYWGGSSDTWRDPLRSKFYVCWHKNWNNWWNLLKNHLWPSIWSFDVATGQFWPFCPLFTDFDTSTCKILILGGPPQNLKTPPKKSSLHPTSNNTLKWL